MKANKVLREYATGKRDFQRGNIRGQSFQGKDLSGANFSEADIRGTNFKNANLTRTKFCKAKAGLQKQWAIVLLLVSWIMSVLSGFISFTFGLLIAFLFTSSDEIEQVFSSTVLIIIIILFVVIFCQGIGGAVAVTVAVVGLGSTTLAGAVAVVAKDEARLVSSVIGISAGVAVAATLAGAVALAVAVALAGTVAVAVAVAIAVVGAGPGAGAVALAIAGAGTGAFTLLGIYVGWRALKGDPRDAWIRTIAIAFAATGGTSFYKADLTDADFTGASLKNTDLREATITRTCWRKTIKLDRARPGNTILADTAIIELLVRGKGYNKSYINGNLRGANLRGANLNKVNLKLADLSEATLEKAELEEADLVDANLRGANLRGAILNKANLKLADLSEATLEDANLQWANLTEANCVGTDFTHAYFTGACLEAWNIESSTKLEDVDCRFVYLLENPKPGTDDRERRPSSGEFQPGEFTKLFQEVFNTVDLIFQDGVNWEAFIKAFDDTRNKVRVENEGTELTVQSIENKGDNVFVIKVNVPPDADKEKIHSDIKQTYETELKVIKERYKLQLNAKDNEIAIYHQYNLHLLEILKLGVSRPIKAIGSQPMSNTQYNEFNNPNYGSIAGRDYTGNVIHNHASDKNLTEAAAEIQQLLNQLSQTNPTTTNKERNAVVGEVVDQIENNPPLKDKVINALKAGSVETFKEAIDHPLVNILMATIEGWTEA
ncbi:pentapeptide repeat-containing protein [Moorena sp. SIO4A5]|uniref:pentapeptide repeat-containing protein n=1 Tax=Moorena sp. SIO4A5 TaxID=2607838 RepID=UPI0013CD9019|nr:pentapeptide repeat-containing protein [Moorena sp. SIO4A5]NEO23046.1 pentapeptide repeat-containing protein [Moorena sp. SIO4A5]